MPSSVKYIAVFVYDSMEDDGIRLVNVAWPDVLNFDHYLTHWPGLETHQPDHWIYVEHEE